MAKTLELVFRNAAGKEVVLSLPDPKDGLTLAEARTVMNDIVSKNIFSVKGVDLVEDAEARVRTSDTVELV
ncbi:MAG TPA: DUF2922 domain-containing protein [Methylomusa anaerophila]|uniref:DUF2922 domain-containing protein n=1 Tax=Methylomusa anaerophila TaxID=1930071 RepID=A0A348AKT5_9FIRM|nr:DUF2922 domain-containing protein [Methylomusa anaerophila]BBB91683.1 hypothetical protein MAMMFC1_02367 [Methylomusa anaerophila]HML88584.1 DUF2922 domain-containing protein [Methylomusa anaerophila]